MNVASHMGSAADLAGGVEWQHAWTPSRPHEAELVRRLPALQRVLLTTDGTVTTALGTVMDEPIGVWLLDQELWTLDCDDDELQLGSGRKALNRTVLLHGRALGRRCCSAAPGSHSAACQALRARRCSPVTWRSV
ncbi:MAG: hypothetical protein ACR2H2_12745 [Solirubrobacteraceae bacterium]